jgi:hypothetical protein
MKKLIVATVVAFLSGAAFARTLAPLRKLAWSNPA